MGAHSSITDRQNTTIKEPQACGVAEFETTLILGVQNSTTEKQSTTIKQRQTFWGTEFY